MSSIPFISKCTNDLLTWKNPIETGKIFVSIIFTLISLKYFNIINLILRLTFYILILSSISEYIGKLIIGTGFITKFKPVYINFMEKNSSLIATKLSDLLICLERQFQDLIYSKDIEKTFKFAIVTYFLYKITSWISIFNLLLISTILSFSLPVIYESNKEQIDEFIKNFTKIAKQKSLELQDTIKTKSGPYLQKLGPVGSFIQSKLPKNRTASTTVGETYAEPVSEPITSTGTASGIDLPNVPTTKLPSTVEVDNNNLENSTKSQIHQTF